MAQILTLINCWTQTWLTDVNPLNISALVQAIMASYVLDHLTAMVSFNFNQAFFATDLIHAYNNNIMQARGHLEGSSDQQDDHLRSEVSQLLCPLTQYLTTGMSMELDSVVSLTATVIQMENSMCSSSWTLLEALEAATLKKLKPQLVNSPYSFAIVYMLLS